MTIETVLCHLLELILLQVIETPSRRDHKIVGIWVTEVWGYLIIRSQSCKQMNYSHLTIKRQLLNVYGQV